MTKPLEPRREAFCQQYVLDNNGAQAAIRAGYSANGASVQATRLLANASVVGRIAELQAERSARTGIDADYVLQRLRDEVEADLADLYDLQGNLKPIHEWPLIWRQGLVVGVDTDELYAGDRARTVVGLTKKLKMSDRASRLVSLGKHVKIQAFRETLEVNNKVSIEDFVLGKLADKG